MPMKFSFSLKTVFYSVSISPCLKKLIGVSPLLKMNLLREAHLYVHYHSICLLLCSSLKPEQ